MAAGIKASPEVENEVARMYSAGEKVGAIMARAGVSLGGLHNILKRKGVPTRPKGGVRWCLMFTPEQEADMVRRYRAGERPVKIGERLGVSDVPVRRVLVSHGIPIRSRLEGRYLNPRYGRITRQTDGIVTDYLAGASSHDLARKHGTDHTNICNVLRKAGVEPRPALRPDALTAEEKERVVVAYGDCGRTLPIAKELGRNQNTVAAVLRSRGLLKNRSDAIRRYAVNESAFDEMTDEAAYWVGYLMADGCVHERSGMYRISASASGEDLGQLESLRRFVGSTHPITVERQASTSYSGGRGTIARFAFPSAKMAAVLARYGVVPRKSLTARVSGGLELNPHFWRGAVDGDGFLSWAVQKGTDTRPDRLKPRMGLTSGSVAFLDQFGAFVRVVRPTCKAAPFKSGTCYAVHLCSVHAYEVARVLYGSGGPALKRKAATAAKFFRDYRPGHPRDEPT